MLKNLTLVAASLVFTLLLGEVALRIAGVEHPEWYIEDPDLAGRLRPGAQGWFRKEGKAYVRINSSGLRDREHAKAKPPGVLRVAVLGDSFAEAMQVDQEHTFWSVLEHRLNACATRKVEVLNFGVSGYGTAQELIMLRRDVWQYDPDIILLAFFTGNDVRNNHRELNGNAPAPYYSVRDGRLVLDDSFRSRLGSLKRSGLTREVREAYGALRGHSRLLQLATQVRAGLRQKRQPERDMADVEKRAANGYEAGIDDAVYAPPRDSRWEEAWRTTEALLTAMRDEVRSHGKELWIVTLSTGIQVHPDQRLRAEFAQRAGVTDLFYPDRRVAAAAERDGVPVITLAPMMAEWSARTGRALHGFPNSVAGFGHWNEEGNRLAGDLIAHRMCESLARPMPGSLSTAARPSF
ncbi:MAG TPA: SGNH/GDSL hydrolase family protein [Bryobacteraceae bacterium]|nr:SGNH/GDSL hydrolase family protein [Bryobacteraceae bacterium]